MHPQMEVLKRNSPFVKGGSGGSIAGEEVEKYSGKSYKL